MTRPLPWMTAVRDHPERPPAMQCHVLWALALRMDWSTGTGFASTAQLAGDADCDNRTVIRATVWARGAQLLEQVTRGHRLGDGTVRASQWALSQGDSADTLRNLKVTETHLKVTEPRSQRDTTTQPSRTRPSRPFTSAPAAAVNGHRPALAVAAVAEICGRCGSQWHKRSECDT